MMREGSRVTYVGLEDSEAPGLLPGETGRLLMIASAHSAHVKMPDGNVYLVHTDDLVEAPRLPLRRASSPSPQPLQDPVYQEPDLLKDSLLVGDVGLSTFAAREAFEEGGVGEVLETMASLGHLSSFDQIAEEVLGMVASRVRQDPSFREVLSALDEEDGESLVRLASTSLIREAFGRTSEGVE